jgi:hypothetical protein
MGVVIVFLDEEVPYLRGLAKEVRDISQRPEQEEKRNKWKEHNSLKGKEPMVFVYPDGAWTELLPDSALRCKSELGRSLEHQLLVKLIRSKYVCKTSMISSSASLTLLSNHISVG